MALLDKTVKKLDKDGKLAVRVINGNALGDAVPVFDFHVSVSQGDFTDIQAVKIQGNVPSINANDSPADIISFETPGLYAFIAIAGTLDVVSDDVNDASAGTGAQNIIITGLIAGFVEAVETVTMNGTTPVTTANSWLRVNDLRVDDVGTDEENVGVITATHGTAGIVATILPGNGNALQAVYTIPTGKSGLLGKWGISTHTTSGGAVTSKEMIAKLKVREPGKGWQVIRVGGERSDGGHLGGNSDYYDLIPAQSDIRMEVEALNNNSAVAGEYELLVVTL